MKIERPKTTGPKSETNHFYGHVRDITEQLLLPRNSWMIAQVARSILLYESKCMDDWPMENGEPVKWSNATGSLAALGIERCHDFASDFGLWLVERGEDGREYRVTY